MLNETSPAERYHGLKPYKEQVAANIETVLACAQHGRAAIGQVRPYGTS